MKNVPNFDEIINRQGSDSMKWDLYGEDILPLWVADMDFRSPKPVIKALQDKIAHGIFGYPKTNEKLLEVIVEWVEQSYSWKISAEDIIILPGVVPGLNLAAQALTKPGDSLLIQSPVYGPFHKIANNANIEQLDSPLRYDQNAGYSIDFDDFKSTIKKNTRIFYLCNPQNPTGRVFNRDELETIADICLKNKTIICSDEIHCDLVYSESKHIPIASLNPEISQNVITYIAPSKTFNIAGLKASVAIIQNHKLRDKIIQAQRGVVHWINSLGQTGMQAAYANGKEWLNYLLLYLEDNRNFLFNYINEYLPEISFVKPEGTYLGWLDCNKLNIDKEPHKFFLENAKVALNDGAWFGKEGKGFVRLNFGCPRETLKEALERMSNSLQEIG